MRCEFLGYRLIPPHSSCLACPVSTPRNLQTWPGECDSEGGVAETSSPDLRLLVWVGLNWVPLPCIRQSGNERVVGCVCPLPLESKAAEWPDQPRVTVVILMLMGKPLPSTAQTVISRSRHLQPLPLAESVVGDLNNPRLLHQLHNNDGIIGASTSPSFFSAIFRPQLLAPWWSRRFFVEYAGLL